MQHNTLTGTTPAYELSWDELKLLVNRFLTGCFGREFRGKVPRSDFSYWSVNLEDTPLTQDEQMQLLEQIGCSELPYECGELFEGDEVTELTQEIAGQLVSAALSFSVDSSVANDYGVVFWGSQIGNPCTIMLSSQYVLTVACAKDKKDVFDTFLRVRGTLQRQYTGEKLCEEIVKALEKELAATIYVQTVDYSTYLEQ